MKIPAKIGAFEFAGDQVRLAVVRTGGKFPAVLELRAATAVYETPEERFDAMVGAVRQLVGETKNTPAAFVLSVPSTWTVVRSVTMSFRGRKRIAAALKFELEPYLAFPIDELVVDFVTTREAAKQTQVLAVGLRRPPVRELMEILAAAGTPAEGIGIDALGLTDIWLSGRRTPAGMNGILHVRGDSATFIVLNGKKLVYLRPLRISLAGIQDNPKAAAREVVNSFRSFRTAWQEAIEEKGTDSNAGCVLRGLTVTGVDLFAEERQVFEQELMALVAPDQEQAFDTRFENLAEKLQGSRPKAGLPAPVIQGGDTTDGVDKAAIGDNRWEGLVGVAANAAGGVGGLDFCRDGLAAREVTRGIRTHLVFSVCLAMSVVVAYGLYLFVDYQRNVSQINKIGQEIWTSFINSFPASEFARERDPGDVGGEITYELMAAEVEAALSRSQSYSLDLFAKPTLLDILVELGDKMPDSQASIQSIAIEGGRQDLITISGEVKDSGAFNNIMNKLRESEILTLDGEPHREVKQGRETFTLRATF